MESPATNKKINSIAGDEQEETKEFSKYAKLQDEKTVQVYTATKLILDVVAN